tara:strand:+ start:4127 stop:4594 length:468 start_codon:yes stop_codon:yes gene_type:complete
LKPARRHYKLNDDVIKKVRFLAEFGAPLEHIAPAAGVSFPALRMWLDNAKGPDPTREEIALLAAVNEGRSKGGMRLISKIAQQADGGDFKAATWMLTHNPAFRDHYSDNAAVTRAKQEGIEAALQAIAEAGLAPDQERDLLLRITAKTGHNAKII